MKQMGRGQTIKWPKYWRSFIPGLVSDDLVPSLDPWGARTLKICRLGSAFLPKIFHANGRQHTTK